MKEPVILIGEAKCGTSSFHAYVVKHPQIHSTKKETNYWTRGTKRRKTPSKEAFLESIKFPSDSDLIPWDASPQYFRSPGTARKIHSLYPKARFVLMLRHPVDRIYSNWVMNHRQRHRLMPPLEELESYYTDNPTTLYDTNLEEWLKYFSLDQFFIVKSEDFYKSERKVVNDLFSWLGLPTIDLEPIRPIVPLAPRQSKPQQHYPPLSDEMKERLHVIYAPRVQRLQKRIGRVLWDDFC